MKEQDAIFREALNILKSQFVSKCTESKSTIYEDDHSEISRVGLNHAEYVPGLKGSLYVMKEEEAMFCEVKYFKSHIVSKCTVCKMTAELTFKNFLH